MAKTTPPKNPTAKGIKPAPQSYPDFSTTKGTGSYRPAPLTHSIDMTTGYRNTGPNPGQPNGMSKGVDMHSVSPSSISADCC